MSRKPAAKRKGASSRQEDAPKAKRAARGSSLSRGQKVVVCFIIVVFALSTLGGALAAVFQGQNAAQNEPVTIETIDEQYQPVVSDLEAKLSSNAEDKDTLLALGSHHLRWGVSVRILATVDAETLHANELLEKAIGYFDRYLELEDSADVRVDRALCEYYTGDLSAARASLEELTESAPDHAPAWANLGMVYESQGETDKALAAYEQAVSLDPDDEAGAKGFAEERISALQKSADDGSDGDEAADGAEPAAGAATGAEGLANDASNLSGTNL